MCCITFWAPLVIIVVTITDTTRLQMVYSVKQYTDFTQALFTFKMLYGFIVHV
jgi:hypothetical protein